MKVIFPGNKKVYAELNGFTIKTDQSPKGGGEGLYPEPFTLFIAALGTCAGIYVKQFCDQRGIDATQYYLEQDMEYDPVKRMISRVHINIHVADDFPEKYEAAVIRAASQCAVKRHLHQEIELITKVVKG